MSTTTTSFRTIHATRRAGRGSFAMVLGAAALLAAAACGGDAILAPSGSQPASAGSHEVIGATNTELPVTGTETNPCNGDAVPYSGKVAYAFFFSDGDNLHEKVKFSWVIDGTAAGTNNVYHGADEYLEEMNVSLLPMEQTFTHHVTMHSQTAPDYKLSFLVHVTISTTGNGVTVEKLPPEECGK